MEKKIGLVADDTFLLLKATQECLLETQDILQDFEQQSGLHINYDKSVICSLGTRRVNYSMLFRNTLVWVPQNSTFKYVGLSLMCNERGQVADSGSWTNIEDKLSRATKQLRYSHSSLLGKILIVKTIIASLSVYKLSLLPTPNSEVLKFLDTFYYHTVWEGKLHKICKKSMEADVNNGGFRMLNVFNQEHSLKFIWLQRLASDTEPHYLWQIQVCNCIKIPVVTFLKLNITPSRIEYFLKTDHKLPKFWCIILKAWFKIRYVTSSDKSQYGIILQRSVCFNSAVPIWQDFQINAYKVPMLTELRYGYSGTVFAGDVTSTYIIQQLCGFFVNYLYTGYKFHSTKLNFHTHLNLEYCIKTGQ